MARLVIGCGTGRCGTTSLAKLLAKQPNVWATHEFMWLPWNFNKYVLHSALIQMVLNIQPDKICIQHDQLENLLFDINTEKYDKNLYRKLFKDRSEDIVADVSYFWLYYLRELIQIFPDIRIICLERDKEEVIDSWMDYTFHGFGMPFFDMGDIPRKDAISSYCDVYHGYISFLQTIYQDNIKIYYPFELVLNDGNYQCDMLDFIGIENKELDTDVWYSKSGGVPSLSLR